MKEIEKDINRPMYFDPQEAKKYGLIDKVSFFLHFGESIYFLLIIIGTNTVERLNRIMNQTNTHIFILLYYKKFVCAYLGYRLAVLH